MYLVLVFTGIASPRPFQWVQWVHTIYVNHSVWEYTAGYMLPVRTLISVRIQTVTIVFTVCLKKPLIINLPKSVQWILWLDRTGSPKLNVYSCLSLSRTRLSRITAYLEVKIWSLPKDENLTTGKKYCGKAISLFPQYFQFISYFKSNYTYICQMWLFELFFPQFCKPDMSRYGYLVVIQRVPWNSR